MADKVARYRQAIETMFAGDQWPRNWSPLDEFLSGNCICAPVADWINGEASKFETKLRAAIGYADIEVEFVPNTHRKKSGTTRLIFSTAFMITVNLQSEMRRPFGTIDRILGDLRAALDGSHWIAHSPYLRDECGYGFWKFYTSMMPIPITITFMYKW